MNNSTTAVNTAKHDVYEIVTERIIAQLEKGTVPWQQPWTEAGLPQNLISKRAYRGINVWLLASLGYSENYFLTYKQLKEFGGSVKKDEKAHIVVYWNFVEKDLEGNENGTQPSNGKSKKVPFLRYYKVFNVAQCNDIPEMFIKPVIRQAYPIPACEDIVAKMPQCPQIKHKDNKAFYNPLSDFVNMPRKESFKSDESYYATLFHELVHSTGHHSRLNRSTLIQMSEFGSEPYSHEELVAEIGTCYLESLAGIITTEFERNASYIQGWLERLKNDKKFILSASSHAQKATDFILNIKFEEKESAEQKDEAQ
ncbi:MAG TPA: zincin-like metallopeptidase domain-containing protein [Chitinophagales bacterium]|nr:zincin-like metallopeptidase domain-containing protein [Chitinophagales bacterium]